MLHVVLAFWVRLCSLRTLFTWTACKQQKQCQQKRFLQRFHSCFQPAQMHQFYQMEKSSESVSETQTQKASCIKLK